MAELLWQPSESVIQSSNLNGYMRWLGDKKHLYFGDYHALWRWSTEHIEIFWASLWEYFNILSDGRVSYVMSDDPMPATRWFEGSRLNYAEHIFRNATDTTDAIVFGSEYAPVKRIQWIDLKRQTAALQQILKQYGVTENDAVTGFLPCIPEATVALLATTSIGATWSSCSPDFGTQAVIDRFAQIEPKVLIAVTEYRYGGKIFDKRNEVEAIVRGISSLKLVLLVSNEGFSSSLNVPQMSWVHAMSSTAAELTFTRVPFSHPLWVLYSSGTTGLPKAITHSHGGILLEQLKYASFHNDFKQGEICFWYTTTGWMMWNYIHSALLTGATMALYDGSPAYPNLNALWRFCEEAGVNHFGTSAGFILANMKAATEPSKSFGLNSIRSISSTGSTLPPEGFHWIYSHVGKHLWLASMSGGTDVCSAFVGGVPTLPVYAGEIQGRALGCKLEAWNDQGEAVIEEEGEMVITKPMPSMPIFFWNDSNFERYRESYFEMYPGHWRHGDWIKVTARNGIIIYGRSDATLNRAGIRIGTSEIYRAVDQVTEVRDSLIVCIEKPDGGFWMPLFVVMKEGRTLTADLKKTINAVIRDAYTPRHVPDEILEVSDIPYTISGKKTETPVKKILMGKDPLKSVNQGSLRNPESLAEFTRFISGAN